jgi:hypothetical protein
MSTERATTAPVSSGVGCEHNVQPSLISSPLPGSESGASGMPIRGPRGTSFSEFRDTVTVFALLLIASSADV